MLRNSRRFQNGGNIGNKNASGTKRATRKVSAPKSKNSMDSPITPSLANLQQKVEPPQPMADPCAGPAANPYSPHYWHARCKAVAYEVYPEFFNEKGGQIGRKGRKMAHGGMHGSCPPGQHMMPDGSCMMGEYHGAPGTPGYRRGGRTQPVPKGRGRRRMGAGGRACGGMGQPPCNGGGYRKGGRTKPVSRRRMARGGALPGISPRPPQPIRPNRIKPSSVGNGGMRMNGNDNQKCPTGFTVAADGSCIPG